MSSSLANNLKNLMRQRSLNESELSRQTSISQPVINRILKGITTNPNVDTLRPIARFLEVSVGQLIGDEDLPEIGQRPESITGVGWVDVPLVTWDWITQSEHFNNEQTTPHQVIRLSGNLSNTAYALIVEDSTMEPSFLKGSILIVEPELKPIDQGYVIVLLQGEKKPVFRQILFNGDRVFLKLLNKDFGGVEAAKNFKILGIVSQTHLYFKKNTIL